MNPVKGWQGAKFPSSMLTGQKFRFAEIFHDYGTISTETCRNEVIQHPSSAGYHKGQSGGGDSMDVARVNRQLTMCPAYVTREQAKWNYN
ncbi:unnamed protein product [Timema podura]|uniref:Uncharacterized protein n=1 Tax=Timema podura TaxID=61482 RepID=A0ABN7P3M0_TIMPD|nr:unnamed protein product [Timema podura]